MFIFLKILLSLVSQTCFSCFVDFARSQEPLLPLEVPLRYLTTNMKTLPFITLTVDYDFLALPSTCAKCNIESLRFQLNDN